MPDIVQLSEKRCYLGRVWLPDLNGPAVVTGRDKRIWDITNPKAPLVPDICEMDDPVAYVRAAPGREIGPLVDLLSMSSEVDSHLRLLVPTAIFRR